MPNNNLPRVSNDSAQEVPNGPFYSENSGKPYLEGPYSPILIGEGIEVCGDYILSPSGEVPIPIGFLSSRGALVSATAPAIPSTISLGNPGQYLAVDLNEPAGIKWADAPVAVGCVSCSEFTAKGDILSATAASTLSALPVGPDGSYLSANQSAANGLEWVSIGYPKFTQKGQVIASCDADCALTVDGVDGDILFYSDSCPAGWHGTCGTALFVPQQGFQKGSLVVGCAQDESDKLAVGYDGQFLVADSTCALGVKWDTFTQNAKQTLGSCYCTTNQSIAQPFNLLGGSEFPTNCKVFVSVTGSWCADGGRSGFLCLANGDTCSAPMQFNNTHAEDARYLFSLNYVFPAWCNTRPLYMIAGNCNGGVLQFCLQTSAFILKV